MTIREFSERMSGMSKSEYCTDSLLLGDEEILNLMEGGFCFSSFLKSTFVESNFQRAFSLSFARWIASWREPLVLMAVSSSSS